MTAHHKIAAMACALALAGTAPAAAQETATSAETPVRTVTFASGDGLEITADLYPGANLAAPTVMLFHQSASSRGEFSAIGPRLSALGFNALAVDLRWGLRRNGVVNATAERHGTAAIMAEVEDGSASPWPTIDASYEDMRAARRWLRSAGYTGPVYALGSSFSAVLVIQLGAEELVDGVIAYSPGEYDESRPERVRGWAARLNIPFHAVAAPGESELVAPVFAAASQSRRNLYFEAAEGRHGASILDEGEDNWLELAGVLSAWHSGLPRGEEIVIPSPGGVNVYADRYDVDSPRATVALFHQGGGSARGEYGFLIPQLLAEGYSVIAADLHGGGDRFGWPNRTETTAPAPEDFAYCDAGRQVALVADYVRSATTEPMVLWGSSYSAALVIREAVREPARIAATLAFSPATGEPMAGCEPELVAADLTSPTLVLRPQNEAAMDGIAAQLEAFRAAGVTTHVSIGTHGSSMLNPFRAVDAAATRALALRFVSDALAAAAASIDAH